MVLAPAFSDSSFQHLKSERKNPRRASPLRGFKPSGGCSGKVAESAPSFSTTQQKQHSLGADFPAHAHTGNWSNPSIWKSLSATIRPEPPNGIRLNIASSVRSASTGRGNLSIVMRRSNVLSTKLPLRPACEHTRFLSQNITLPARRYQTNRCVKFRSTTTRYFPPGITPSVPRKLGINFCTGAKVGGTRC